MLQADIIEIRATDCESCPRGNGEKWCKGDCYWRGGEDGTCSRLLTTIQRNFDPIPAEVPNTPTVVSGAIELNWARPLGAPVDDSGDDWK